ncbi:MAG: D-amino acid dehydrogenase [Rhodocyclaceae bacterium]|nr:D-amino acid dehydrogenase [Rhodocyclaceae bacterium]
MEICVIGGGIVGLATAWYLKQDGHDVTLVEARAGVGMGTSYANGGQLSYRYIAPLADPDVLAKIPAWMLRSDAPVRFRPAFDPEQWRWLLGFLQACNQRDLRYSVAALLPLSLYSKRLIGDLVDARVFDFQWRRNGKLVVHRSEESFAAARRLLDTQPELASEQRAIDAEACLGVEPALARMAPNLRGGIHTPGEEVGDCLALCRGFEQALAAGERPVQVLLGEAVEQIETAGGRLQAVVTASRRLTPDACVVASGVDAGKLLKPLGVTVPIYPLKGYSISPPVREDGGVPSVSITDYQRKIVYARIGNRLRVAGMADIVGFDTSVKAARIGTLVNETRENFGDALDYGDLAEWAGLRPATPTGRPIVGAAPVAGLWLNLGQGALGFTLAAGCGRVLADRIAGRQPAVPDEPFSLSAALQGAPEIPPGSR